MRTLARMLPALALAPVACGLAWSDAPAIEDGDYDWMLDALWICVLGYIALQVMTARRLAGGWRIAALLPLLVGIPVLLSTLAGLAAGANLWPLLMLLLAPLGLVYLLGLLAARALARGLSGW